MWYLPVSSAVVANHASTSVFFFFEALIFLFDSVFQAGVPSLDSEVAICEYGARPFSIFCFLSTVLAFLLAQPAYAAA